MSPRRPAPAAWWLLAGWLATASLPAHAAPKLRGSIVIDGAEPGSEVLLDGAPVGTTPLEPIPALRGDHQVSVRKGPADFTRTVTVKAGETIVVKVAAKVTATPSAADEQALDLDLDMPSAETPARRRPRRPEPATPAQAPTPTASTPPAPSSESTLDALPELDLDFDLPPEPPPAVAAPVSTTAGLAPAPQEQRATPGLKGPAPETARPVEARREPPAAAPDPFVLPIDEPRAPSRAEGAAAPVYRQAWFWAVVGTAAAAAVVVPLLVGASSDPGYVEVRDPAVACPGCGLVLNP